MISAAQLLDELMGRDRNLAPDEKRSNVRWDHESVSPVGLGPVPKRLGEGRRGRARARPGDLGSGSRRPEHLTAAGGGRAAREGGFRANPGDRAICCSGEEVRDCARRARKEHLGEAGKRGKKEGRAHFITPELQAFYRMQKKGKSFRYLGAAIVFGSASFRGGFVSTLLWESRHLIQVTT